MKKNINLVIDGIAPEKVMYDTDNHSLVVLYPAQEEFKRGDILHSDFNNYTYIFHSLEADGAIQFFALNRIDEYGYLRVMDKEPLVGVGFMNNRNNHRLATPEEQQVLFDALKKEGKMWNAETLQVEDLDISEIAIDLESAKKYLGIGELGFNFNVYNLVKGSRESKYFAQITLQLIREAWNKFDGFVVDYASSEQSKYYPIINLFAGNIEVGVGCVNATVHSACYSFPTSERALQFGTQFKELLKTAMGI